MRPAARRDTIDGGCRTCSGGYGGAGCNRQLVLISVRFMAPQIVKEFLFCNGVANNIVRA